MSIRILLADDHELVRQSLRYMLESESDSEVVGEAGDGREAVKLAEELQPDVVVLDIEMPGMDGIKAAREIMAKSPSMKILALSMHSERGYVSEIFKAGAAGYILKDSAFEELVRAIKTVVSDQKYISPGLVDIVIEGFTGGADEEKSPGLSKLTARELEVLQMVAEGNSSKEIAYHLDLSVKTVDAHRRQIMQRLEIDNIADLIKFAIREKLVDL